MAIRSLGRISRYVLVAVIGLSVGGMGGVLSAGLIPGADGVIQGCYQAPSGRDGAGGALRVVSDASLCRRGEIAISWNQRGPAGPAGLAGPAGPAGATGPAGPGLPSLDALDGLPCGTGASAGTTRVTYAAGGAVSIACLGAGGGPAGHLLNVARSGPGIVTSTPPGIYCGGDCTESYAAGTLVTLVAAADAGATFSGWSGCDSVAGSTCILTMSAARAVSATFVTALVPLTVMRSGSGSGVVTSAPPGISCGSDCSESYASGTNVALTATADSGSTFGSWTGCFGVATTCTVVLTAPLAVTAVFNGTAGTDADGDGYATPADCNDADPTIHPDAPDLPDLAFIDRNCDGIDGDESLAIFVSPAGNDSDAGTRSAPKLTLASAVAAAAAAGRNVYAQAGVYPSGGGLVLASNVGVYGGYSYGWTTRSLAPATEIQGSPQAVLASFASNAALQLVTLRSTPVATGSGYGLRALSSTVSIERVSIFVSAGANGSAGTSDTSGASGGAGGGGLAGSCDGATPGPGGSGGSSAIGRPGGAGGLGGPEGSNDGSPGSDGAGPGGGSGGSGGRGGASTFGSTPGSPGGNGQPGLAGTPGATGVGGSGGTVVGGEWSSAAGTAGNPGGAGNGGGGGGGGGGQGGPAVDDGSGNGGGGGGGAGAGATGGNGGTGGGASFGVLLVDSTLTALGTGSSITTASGGAGGAGGPGGAGGAGGSGGPGATVCTGEVGAGGNGGAGGRGGDGGQGGGGAGGPSVGIYRAGTSSLVMTAGAIAFTIGAGGAPGSPNGAPGVSAQIQ